MHLQPLPPGGESGESLPSPRLQRSHRGEGLRIWLSEQAGGELFHGASRAEYTLRHRPALTLRVCATGLHRGEALCRRVNLCFARGVAAEQQLNALLGMRGGAELLTVLLARAAEDLHRGLSQADWLLFAFELLLAANDLRAKAGEAGAEGARLAADRAVSATLVFFGEVAAALPRLFPPRPGRKAKTLAYVEEHLQPLLRETGRALAFKSHPKAAVYRNLKQLMRSCPALSAFLLRLRGGECVEDAGFAAAVDALMRFAPRVERDVPTAVLVEEQRGEVDAAVEAEAFVSSLLVGVGEEEAVRVREETTDLYEDEFDDTFGPARLREISSDDESEPARDFKRAPLPTRGRPADARGGGPMDARGGRLSDVRENSPQDSDDNDSSDARGSSPPRKRQKRQKCPLDEPGQRLFAPRDKGPSNARSNRPAGTEDGHAGDGRGRRGEGRGGRRRPRGRR